MSISSVQASEIIELYSLPDNTQKNQQHKRHTSYSSTGQRLNVVDYLSKNGRECIGTKSHGSSTLFLLKACLFDDSHGKAESAIGQTDEGKLFYQCFHDSCKNHTWKEARQIISGDASLFSGNKIRQADKHGTKNQVKNDQPDSPLPLTKKNKESDPFPFESLGTTMAAACKSIQDVIQAPGAMIAQCLLAAANLAVQPLRNVKIDGREFPLSLFLLTMGATGERKSAVDNVALDKHREMEKEAIKIMTEGLSLYELQNSAYEYEKSALIKDRKKSLEERTAELEYLKKQEPSKPLDQTVLVADFTSEGLYKLFQTGVPSKGLFADEGGQVAGGHGMKTESILATAAFLSKLWDGTKVDRVRVIDGSSHLYNRRLSVHLMMQDKVGLSFFNNEILKDQGLCSRLLTAWPTSTVGSREYNPVNVKESVAVQAFYQKVSDAMQQPVQYIEDSNEQEIAAPAFMLSPEAKQLWEGFYSSVETESAPKKHLASIRGLSNKAAEHAARIAATVQIFEKPTSTEIGSDSMQCGIAAMSWYLDEALRIAGSFNPSGELQRAKEVLRWIHEQKLPIVTLPDIYQYSPVRSAPIARQTVKVLQVHNHLLEPKLSKGETISPHTGMNGKRSREWWSVHPESNASFIND